MCATEERGNYQPISSVGGQFVYEYAWPAVHDGPQDDNEEVPADVDRTCWCLPQMTLKPHLGLLADGRMMVFGA